MKNSTNLIANTIGQYVTNYLKARGGLSPLRIDNDFCGNPRYYIGAYGFILSDSSLFRPNFASAYRGRKYGAGYVFQSYNIQQDIEHSLRVFFEGLLLSTCKRLVLDSIDLSDYPKRANIKGVLLSEYGSKPAKATIAEHCRDYLQGLPSVCTIPFANYTILQHLKSAGFDLELLDDDLMCDFIDSYWLACGAALAKRCKL